MTVIVQISLKSQNEDLLEAFEQAVGPRRPLFPAI